MADAPAPRLIFSTPIKALASLAAILIAGTAVAGALGIVSVRNFFVQSINPKYMAETATYITGLANPVPEPGFTEVMAAKMTRAVVFLVNEKEKTQVSFWRYEGQDLDAAQELDKVYDFGVWSPTTMAKFQSITSKGKKEINGKTVSYLEGPMKDQLGDTYEGLIACYIEGEKIVLVQAMQPSDRPLDRDKVLTWLAHP